MNKKIVSIVALSAAALTTQACSDGASVDGVEGAVESESAALSATAADGTVVATVQTRAGTTISFVTSDDDELGYGIVGTIGRADPELTAAKGSTGDAVQLFERIAGTTAPKALKDANDRAVRASAAAEIASQGSGASPGPGLMAPSNPQASSGFCDITNWVSNGSGPFETCWPNQFSTPWQKAHVDHMSCRFDVVQGPTHVRYRYWTAGGSHTPADYWLSSGQYMEWHGAYRYAKRDRECKTVENPHSRKLHFRVVGYESMAAVPYNPISVFFPDP